MTARATSAVLLVGFFIATHKLVDGPGPAWAWLLTVGGYLGGIIAARLWLPREEAVPAGRRAASIRNAAAAIIALAVVAGAVGGSTVVRAVVYGALILATGVFVLWLWSRPQERPTAWSRAAR